MVPSLDQHWALRSCPSDASCAHRSLWTWTHSCPHCLVSRAAEEKAKTQATAQKAAESEAAAKAKAAADAKAAEAKKAADAKAAAEAKKAADA